MHIAQTNTAKKLRFGYKTSHPKRSFFHASKIKTLFAACLIAGCGAAVAAERIVDLGNQREISREALVASLKQGEFILLGELHDNPAHHADRAWLLEKLAAARPVIVAEHLERGRSAAGEGELLPTLENAGFDARNWRWPLHRPLFEAARQSARALVGGNIERQTARAIVKEKASALPADIAAAIAAAPLTENARQTLEQDLLDNHCGQIPASLIPGLSLAQRARDAAMALALEAAVKDGTPALLLAGNGHVRRDYGVPVLLDALASARKTIAVGFLESDKTFELHDAALKARYDFIWITNPATREDPCLNFPKR